MLEIKLGVPQIVWLAIMIFDIVYVTINHGKEREPHNAYTFLISAAINFALLCWGGFFN